MLPCNWLLFFTPQDNQVEAPEESSKKMKSFFIHAVDNWDAKFYVKVNDDVFVNLGMQSFLYKFISECKKYGVLGLLEYDYVWFAV